MVEVSSLSRTVTQSEKVTGGWWLMIQKDREREREVQHVYPLLVRLRFKNARGPLLIIAEENKARFQRGLVSMSHSFQLT